MKCYVIMSGLKLTFSSWVKGLNIKFQLLLLDQDWRVENSGKQNNSGQKVFWSLLDLI